VPLAAHPASHPAAAQNRRVHSIELLLDDVTDTAVRDSWAALAEAGLPSLAHHAGETNAPHVSLSVAARLDDRADPRLRRISDALPLPLELGGLVVFGRPPRGLVLARAVVPTAALLALHHDVHESAGGAAPVAHTAPGRWTPHVTLASRLTPDQLARAVEVLAGAEEARGTTTPVDPDAVPVPPETGRLVTLRRWDSDARTVTVL
jgi:2'-5' RNA ligase